MWLNYHHHHHHQPFFHSSRKQHLQLGCLLLCLVCILPTRLVTLKWRFPSFRKAGPRTASSGNIHKAIINNTAECRYFPEALFQFTNALQTSPEQTALRPWSLNLHHHKYPMWHFPGLSSALLQQAFRGKRLALVGDSTLFYMERWMQTLLGNMTETSSNNNEVDDLMNMDMTQANELVSHYHYNPDDEENAVNVVDSVEYHQVGWSNVAPPEVRLADGTVVVWSGFRGSPGETACHFDSVWKRVLDGKPQILVVNFGLHWLHLMGAGRDVPLCYVEAWLTYEDWLQSIVDMARASGSVKLLLFKTTNYICEELFWGNYADGAALYKEGGKHVEKARQRCHHLIQELVRDNTAGNGLRLDMLGAENITRYCSKAVFDEYGVKDLNHRLLEFVQKQQKRQPKGKLEQSTTANPTNVNDDMTIAIFNDHDLQSCAYSEPNDGRHYHPLNLMRIRLLANTIQCLYKDNNANINIQQP